MNFTNTQLFSLPELLSINVDSWVNAISHLAANYGGEVDNYNSATDCPAEYEAEFRAVAEKHGVLFTKAGAIYDAMIDTELDAELTTLRSELRSTIIQGAIGLALVTALLALGFALGH